MVLKRVSLAIEAHGGSSAWCCTEALSIATLLFSIRTSKFATPKRKKKKKKKEHRIWARDVACTRPKKCIRADFQI